MLGGGSIPKRIHQIWLGRNPRPEPWMKTVRDFAAEHGYEYCLWTEEKVKDLDWDAIPGLQAVYKEFGHELAGRADLIRLLVLYKEGGIYIDADSVMMRPEKFAAFLEDNKAGLFFGWEELSKARTKKLGDLGPGMTGTRRLVANGMIGARVGHPFIKLLLENVVANAEKEAGEQAWRRVGPLFVTRMYRRYKGKFPDIKIYPMRYFYPRHWKGITDPELHKKVRIPGESMLFQYGYSTNGFDKIFARRQERERRRTRRLRKA